ncbi:unnamed protein product [Oppiella nova]|uniref:Caspase family p20 domain-containing protein n=1 Tax=Oppiella nova TaxID=334625 RepID=A0A7R9QGY7_9ACAR|nr:unnamed protein product [Oppiella nova]CAG2165627.1 unnamed protein product [Oppiella nova]
MNLLKTHPCAYMLPDIEELKNEREKIIRIFSTFVLNRHNCTKMADILEQSGQTKHAKWLRDFNQSEPVWHYSDEVNLQVTKSTTMNSATTVLLKMDSKPRGKAVIFVNIKSLLKEAERFKYILQQLEFDVDDIIAQCSNKVMRDKLGELAIMNHDKHDAFFMMFIGHGQNEELCCTDKNVPIKDIAYMFSEANCLELRNKPKIFVFNCCRIGNDTKRMFMIYSCEQDECAYYQGDKGFTYFGRAFSHVIAQYACSRDILEIILRTSFRLEEDMKQAICFAKFVSTSLSPAHLLFPKQKGRT